MPHSHRHPKALNVAMECFISDVERLYKETQGIKKKYNGVFLAASPEHMRELRKEIALIKNFKLDVLQDTVKILAILLCVQIERHEEKDD